MSSSTAPKVGDTITTYDQLKQLPDGTVLTFNRLDGASRFVQHDGDTANLLDKDGDLRNWASAAHPLGDVSYVVTSIPEADPEPEPEWRVGQTVDTYEELRKLPEGTVITRDADGRRRTIETRGGVLGAWDHEGGIMLLGESGGDSFAGATPKYTIARLPVATEARAHIGAAPAAECRAAASKLRELAQRATPGPWRLGSDRWAALVADRKHPDRMVGGGWEWDDAYGGCLVAESLMRPDREYFATMNPLVGAALAGLLDEVAGHAESNDEYDGFPPESVITGYTPAVTIARLINGDAS